MSGKRDQSGIAHLMLLIGLIAVIVIALAGWRVMSTKETDDNTDTVNTSDNSNQQPTAKKETSNNDEQQISWMWNGSAWSPSATAPDCSEPVSFSQTPVATDKVSGILYPGQKRGGNYKPHGGFKLNTPSNEAEVVAIMDGYVTSGSRYIEAGEVQYMFTIVNNCGIAYRYDHLLELSPTFQKLADLLPEPKKDDSRTTNITQNNRVKSGDVIATAVGFKNTANHSFDLGVYDYRQTNDAAKRGTINAQGLPDLSQAGYALCWLDMFEDVDYRSYPAVDAASGKTSDYCN